MPRQKTVGQRNSNGVTGLKTRIGWENRDETGQDGERGPRETTASDATRTRTPLTSAIRTPILRRLGDPALDPSLVAQELGCSLSNLHLHRQKSGQSFGLTLMTARLDAAARALKLTAPHPGYVERIAFGCGFNDTAHFSRRFKDRFGTAPTPDPLPLPTPGPEPATWTMLIAGFGPIGAAMRRHRPALVQAAA